MSMTSEAGNTRFSIVYLHALFWAEIQIKVLFYIYFYVRNFAHSALDIIFLCLFSYFFIVFCSFAFDLLCI